MKSGKEALQAIPLHCISTLTSVKIAEIFGVSESWVSLILSEKYAVGGLTYSKFKSKDEDKLKCKGSWMKSKEREYIKQVNK